MTGTVRKENFEKSVSDGFTVPRKSMTLEVNNTYNDDYLDDDDIFETSRDEAIVADRAMLNCNPAIMNAHTMGVNFFQKLSLNTCFQPRSHQITAKTFFQITAKTFFQPRNQQITTKSVIVTSKILMISYYNFILISHFSSKIMPLVYTLILRNTDTSYVRSLLKRVKRGAIAFRNSNMLYSEEEYEMRKSTRGYTLLQLPKTLVSEKIILGVIQKIGVPPSSVKSILVSSKQEGTTRLYLDHLEIRCKNSEWQPRLGLILLDAFKMTNPTDGSITQNVQFADTRKSYVVKLQQPLKEGQIFDYGKLRNIIRKADRMGQPLDTVSYSSYKLILKPNSVDRENGHVPGIQYLSFGPKRYNTDNETTVCKTCRLNNHRSEYCITPADEILDCLNCGSKFCANLGSVQCNRLARKLNAEKNPRQNNAGADLKADIKTALDELERQRLLAIQGPGLAPIAEQNSENDDEEQVILLDVNQHFPASIDNSNSLDNQNAPRATLGAVNNNSSSQAGVQLNALTQNKFAKLDIQHIQSQNGGMDDGSDEDGPTMPNNDDFDAIDEFLLEKSNIDPTSLFQFFCNSGQLFQLIDTSALGLDSLYGAVALHFGWGNEKASYARIDVIKSMLAKPDLFKADYEAYCSETRRDSCFYSYTRWVSDRKNSQIRPNLTDVKALTIAFSKHLPLIEVLLDNERPVYFLQGIRIKPCPPLFFMPAALSLTLISKNSLFTAFQCREKRTDDKAIKQDFKSQQIQVFSEILAQGRFHTDKTAVKSYASTSLSKNGTTSHIHPDFPTLHKNQLVNNDGFSLQNPDLKSAAPKSLIPSKLAPENNQHNDGSLNMMNLTDDRSISTESSRPLSKSDTSSNQPPNSTLNFGSDNIPGSESFNMAALHSNETETARKTQNSSSGNSIPPFPNESCTNNLQPNKTPVQLNDPIQAIIISNREAHIKNHKVITNFTPNPNGLDGALYQCNTGDSVIWPADANLKMRSDFEDFQKQKEEDFARREAEFVKKAHELAQREKEHLENTSGKLTPLNQTDLTKHDQHSMIPSKNLIFAESSSHVDSEPSQNPSTSKQQKTTRSRHPSGNGLTARHNSPVKQIATHILPTLSVPDWSKTRGDSSATEYNGSNYPSKSRGNSSATEYNGNPFPSTAEQESETNNVFNELTSNDDNQSLQEVAILQRSHSRSLPAHPNINVTSSSNFLDLDRTDERDISALANKGTPGKITPARLRSTRNTPAKKRKSNHDLEDEIFSQRNLKKQDNKKKKFRDNTDSRSISSNSNVLKLRGVFSPKNFNLNSAENLGHNDDSNRMFSNFALHLFNMRHSYKPRYFYPFMKTLTLNFLKHFFMPRPRNSPTNATVSAIQHQPSLTKTIFEKHHPRPVRLTIRSQMINFHRPHKMLMLPAHQESPEATPDLRTVLTIRIYPTPEPFPVKISNPTVYDFKIHEISHFLKKIVNMTVFYNEMSFFSSIAIFFQLGSLKILFQKFCIKTLNLKSTYTYSNKFSGLIDLIDDNCLQHFFPLFRLFLDAMSGCICIVTYKVTANIGLDRAYALRRTTHLIFNMSNSIHIQNPLFNKYVSILAFPDRQRYENFKKLSNATTYTLEFADVQYPKHTDVDTVCWLLNEIKSLPTDIAVTQSALIEKVISILERAIINFYRKKLTIYHKLTLNFYEYFNILTFPRLATKTSKSTHSNLRSFSEFSLPELYSVIYQFQKNMAPSKHSFQLKPIDSRKVSIRPIKPTLKPSQIFSKIYDIFSRKLLKRTYLYCHDEYSYTEIHSQISSLLSDDACKHKYKIQTISKHFFSNPVDFKPNNSNFIRISIYCEQTARILYNNIRTSKLNSQPTRTPLFFFRFSDIQADRLYTKILFRNIPDTALLSRRFLTEMLDICRLPPLYNNFTDSAYRLLRKSDNSRTNNFLMKTRHNAITNLLLSKNTYIKITIKVIIENKHDTQLKPISHFSYNISAISSNNIFLDNKISKTITSDPEPHHDNKRCNIFHIYAETCGIDLYHYTTSRKNHPKIKTCNLFSDFSTRLSHFITGMGERRVKLAFFTENLPSNVANIIINPCQNTFENLSQQPLSKRARNDVDVITHCESGFLSTRIRSILITHKNNINPDFNDNIISCNELIKIAQIDNILVKSNSTSSPIDTSSNTLNNTIQNNSFSIDYSLNDLSTENLDHSFILLEFRSPKWLSFLCMFFSHIVDFCKVDQLEIKLFPGYRDCLNSTNTTSSFALHFKNDLALDTIAINYFKGQLPSCAINNETEVTFFYKDSNRVEIESRMVKKGTSESLRHLLRYMRRIGKALIFCFSSYFLSNITFPILSAQNYNSIDIHHFSQPKYNKISYLFAKNNAFHTLSCYKLPFTTHHLSHKRPSPNHKSLQTRPHTYFSSFFNFFRYTIMSNSPSTSTPRVPHPLESVTPRRRLRLRLNESNEDQSGKLLHLTKNIHAVRARYDDSQFEYIIKACDENMLNKSLFFTQKYDHFNPNNLDISNGDLSDIIDKSNLIVQTMDYVFFKRTNGFENDADCSLHNTHNADQEVFSFCNLDPFYKNIIYMASISGKKSTIMAQTNIPSYKIQEFDRTTAFSCDNFVIFTKLSDQATGNFFCFHVNGNIIPEKIIHKFAEKTFFSRFKVVDTRSVNNLRFIEANSEIQAGVNQNHQAIVIVLPKNDTINALKWIVDIAANNCSNDKYKINHFIFSRSKKNADHTSISLYLHNERHVICLFICLSLNNPCFFSVSLQKPIKNIKMKFDDIFYRCAVYFYLYSKQKFFLLQASLSSPVKITNFNKSTHPHNDNYDGSTRIKSDIYIIYQQSTRLYNKTCVSNFHTQVLTIIKLPFLTFQIPLTSTMPLVKLFGPTQSSLTVRDFIVPGLEILCKYLNTRIIDNPRLIHEFSFIQTATKNIIQLKQISFPKTYQHHLLIIRNLLCDTLNSIARHDFSQKFTRIIEITDFTINFHTRYPGHAIKPVFEDIFNDNLTVFQDSAYPPYHKSDPCSTCQTKSCKTLPRKNKTLTNSTSQHRKVPQSTEIPHRRDNMNFVFRIPTKNGAYRVLTICHPLLRSNLLEILYNDNLVAEPESFSEIQRESKIKYNLYFFPTPTYFPSSFYSTPNSLFHDCSFHLMYFETQTSKNHNFFCLQHLFQINNCVPYKPPIDTFFTLKIHKIMYVSYIKAVRATRTNNLTCFNQRPITTRRRCSFNKRPILPRISHTSAKNPQTLLHRPLSTNLCTATGNTIRIQISFPVNDSIRNHAFQLTTNKYTLSYLFAKLNIPDHGHLIFFNENAVFRKNRRFTTDLSLTGVPYNTFGSDQIYPTCPYTNTTSDSDVSDPHHIDEINDIIRHPINDSDFLSMGNDSVRLSDAVFSFLILNTSGKITSRNRSYNSNIFNKKVAIITESDPDTLISMSEINLQSNDATLLHQQYAPQGDVRIYDCSDVDYTEKNGFRSIRSKGSKISGFGHAMLDKTKNGNWILDAHCMNDVKMHFEIAARIVQVGAGLFGLCVSFYRSPSMRDPFEISLFYKTIANVVNKVRNENQLHFIIAGGDDNSTPVNVAIISKNTFENLGLTNLIGDTKTRYDKKNKKEFQPDSVYGWNDFANTRLTAKVRPKLVDTMDHYPIRVNVHCSNIVPRQPIYRKITRQVKHESDYSIAMWFSEHTQLFCDFVQPIIDNSKTHDIQNKTIDKVTEKLFKLFEDVKAFAWHEVVSVVSDNVKDTDKLYDVRVAQQMAKMEAKLFEIKNNNFNEERLKIEQDALYELCDRYHELLFQANERVLRLDMAHQDATSRQRNTNIFQKVAKNLCNKRQGAFSDTIDQGRTEEQINADLEKHDKTFHCPDPDFIANYNQIMDDAANNGEKTLRADGSIVSYKDYIDDFDTEKFPEHLPNIIANMPKIDKIYKINRYFIARAIFLVCKLASIKDYWPFLLRISKLTFIPGRAIFSLKPINKIFEAVFAYCVTKCRDEKFIILKKDPIACAYMSDRGTESCNLISYTMAEYAMNTHKTCSIQIAADLMKAFNKAHRPRMITELQITAQAAKLAVSRFFERCYEFLETIRGLGPELFPNQGTDAGATMAVLFFSLFMDTDQHFSNFNEFVEWASYYSDDRCPIISGHNIGNTRQENCGAKKTLDGTWDWAQVHKVSYHMIGKKASEILIFRKKIKGSWVSKPGKLITYEDTLDDKDNTTIRRCQLSLGNQDIRVVDNMTVLGLNVCTSPETHIFDDKQKQKIHLKQANNIIEKHGYLFNISINDFKNTAYRIIQFLNYTNNPAFLKLLVSSYMCGRIRFCSSLHWARATEKQIQTVRFYYMMTCSAIIGLNAFTTLGGSCCFRQSTKFTNDVKKLLQMCGLPSILEMSVNNAKSTITQTRGMKPELFFSGTKREQKSEQVAFLEFVSNRNKRRESWRVDQTRQTPLNSNFKHEKHYIPKATNRSFDNTLVHHVHKLACKSITALEEERAVDNIRNFSEIQQIVNQSWDANENNAQDFPEFTYKSLMFKFFCKQEFRCLEQNVRRNKCKTPSYKELFSKPIECKTRPPNIYFNVIEPQLPLNCDTIWGPRDINNAELTSNSTSLCRICEQPVTFDKFRTKLRKELDRNRCIDCRRVSHIKCTDKLSIHGPFRCSDFSRKLKPNAEEFDTAFIRVPPTREVCLICGVIHKQTFSERHLQNIKRNTYHVNEDDSKIIWCNKRCLHGAHLSCVKTNLFDVTFSNSNSSLDPDTILTQKIHNFTCDNVITLDTNKSLQRLSDQLPNSIPHITSEPRQLHQRYPDNCGDTFCDFCKKWVSPLESDHELYHCSVMRKYQGITNSINDPINYRRYALSKLTVNNLDLQKKTRYNWEPGINS